MNTPIIRLIKKEDNPQVAKVIRSVFEDMNIPKTGTAYEDKALDCMFESYTKKTSCYFVVEDNNTIIGGAGIAKLENYEGEDRICELQKMYFLPEARGKGLGRTLIKMCLVKAREFNFEKCYIETMPDMTAAQNLYKSVGFETIDAPLGNTGHHSCPVHMLMKL
ncbi:GNAT family N-acetyltransferase [Marixanthomonas sp. SCSIO 43207]|uniref:GNAT family N-acetyltransferase n=1 Tax=Marixanthomonas sp. SCSIO 43207 TaxID=2779360 RepID=UPI001CA8DE9C|nr:GNAT family N-acetyltransferase [Marixanthomonas sp. SCSIO 43207]UAB81175.1 GNAT family N-acetyltransferase [Marixanthomonas sp. SCSIO 43207]